MATASDSKRKVLSRSQLEVFVRCPRCFWLMKRHGVRPPESYPYTLNNALDGLVKREFDGYRAKGELPPILKEANLQARLFLDTDQLRRWRSNQAGLRWKDGLTGYLLTGALDDLLEFPDGRLAVLDFKASGKEDPCVYPDYQLQLDVYTFLLQQMGYRTAPFGYIAFFVVVKDAGFLGRLPFKGLLRQVDVQPDRVSKIFKEAVILAESKQAPDAGPECDLCRWFDEARDILI